MVRSTRSSRVAHQRATDRDSGSFEIALVALLLPDVRPFVARDYEVRVPLQNGDPEQQPRLDSVEVCDELIAGCERSFGMPLSPGSVRTAIENVQGRFR